MKPETDTPFKQWLKEATQGIPVSSREITNLELQAHYEDAIQNYLAQGMDEAASAQAALADLGDPNETDSALKAVHLTPCRYLMAAALALASPLYITSLSAALYDPFWSKYWMTGYDAICLLTLPVVLVMFIKLLNENGLEQAKPVFNKVLWTIIIAETLRLIYFVLFDIAPHEVIDTTTISLQKALEYTLLILEFYLSINLLLAGWELIRSRVPLFGARFLIGISYLLTGIIAGATDYAILTFNYLAANLLTFLFFFTMSLCLVSTSFLFLRIWLGRGRIPLKVA